MSLKDKINDWLQKTTIETNDLTLRIQNFGIKVRERRLLKKEKKS